MNEHRVDTVLGIVGGMGPLASAEFLKTIYECGAGEREQEALPVIMYSDPAFPDRTDAFLAGDEAPLLERLSRILDQLLHAGATRLVFCCVTIHYLLPRLPQHLRERTISLLDVIFEQVLREQKRYLLICSTGSRRLGLFSEHPLWPRASGFIVQPDEADQDRIHRDLIYPIKKNPDLRTLFPLLEWLLARYEVDSFIAGCSELHILAKHYAAGKHGKSYDCLDPLAIIARELCALERA